MTKKDKQLPLFPEIEPEVMALFPTMGSLQAVIDLAESSLPITNKNDSYALLMTYHNTLLAEIQHGKEICLQSLRKNNAN